MTPYIPIIWTRNGTVISERRTSLKTICRLLRTTLTLVESRMQVHLITMGQSLTNIPHCTVVRLVALFVNFLFNQFHCAHFFVPAG